MNSDLEAKVRSALEKGRPLIESVIADLEREATIIRERDLDPRKFAEDPRVQEARSTAVDALEHLTEFAKSLDSLAKSYASEIDKRVDVGAIKEQIANAPAAGKARFEHSNGADLADRVKTSSDEVKETVDSAAQRSKEQAEAAAQEARVKAEAAAQQSKEYVESAVHKGKDSTAEMLAALGWAVAAAAVIYMVFMDEKRRAQTKKVAKAAGSGITTVVNSAAKKS